jgi:exosortase
MAVNENASAEVGEKPVRAASSLSLWLEWPRSAILFGVVLLALYAQGLAETATLWFRKDEYSHGPFILPLCAFVLYLNRDAIRDAIPRPSALGIPLVAGGLLLQFFGYIMRLGFLEMWSVIPVLIGAVLLLHGSDMLRITRFPILFAFFAFPLPIPVLTRISLWIQHASTTGARYVMEGLGYSVLQHGNLIEIPGYTLEVADVCSGFKKLTALVAFSILYGYLFPISPWKKVALFLAAVPIAVIANVLRVSGLIAVTSAGGLSALHLAHNWGEIVALVIAFFLFVFVGKVLGCRNIRFSSPSAS